MRTLAQSGTAGAAAAAAAAAGPSCRQDRAAEDTARVVTGVPRAVQGMPTQDATC
jgi:hypothetical protein